MARGIAIVFGNVVVQEREVKSNEAFEEVVHSASYSK
jgi:hypothetical protein